MDFLTNKSVINRYTKAQLLLSLFSPDQIEDIVALVNQRGTSVINDIAGDKSYYKPAPIFGVLSRELIPDEETPSLLLALTTILVAQLRKPTFGHDEYKALLENAFSLPSSMAEELATNIETYDTIAVKGEDGFSWANLGAKIADGVRRFLNAIPAIFNIPWEIDQTQKFDVDMLYELSRFGDAVAQMQRRASLMTAQSLISQNVGMFNIGDPDDTDSAERQLGDALASLNTRTLPRSVVGPFGKLISMGEQAKVGTVQKMASEAGYNVTKDGTIAPTGYVKHPGLRKAWDKILAGRPGKAALIGALAGLAPGIAMGLNSGVGDPTTSDVYGDVQDVYGDTVADAWVRGDIESIVEHGVHDLLNNDHTTGDPDIDGDIEHEAASSLSHDDISSPEIGGLITRVRANAAKKRFVRKRAKAQRKAGRIDRRNVRRATRDAQRDAVKKYRAAAASEVPSKYVNQDVRPSFDYEADFQSTVEDTEFPPVPFDEQGFAENGGEFVDYGGEEIFLSGPEAFNLYDNA